MTDKQTDELVKKKLVDYLNQMGHLPDKAGRYHCIATDHKDGNPSMTIHKSGTYATCWSHPSPKDSFTIFDAIGVFEGIQSPRAQKKRAYEIYQNEIDEFAAELTAKADAKTSDETKQPTHAPKPKETTRAASAEPKQEDKTAVKAPEHKYTRPVKPDIFAPKPKVTPPPPPEPIVLKTEEKAAVKIIEPKEPPLPESAALKESETPPPASATPKAVETPPPVSAAPEEEQKVAAKTPDHKEIPSPDTAVPKTDIGSTTTAPESTDDKTPAAKVPAPPVIPKTGSQRTIDNRPPSVDFQEWKKRVSQIYNLKMDSKPEALPRTPQTVKDAEIKQSPPPAEPVKPSAEPVKPPIEPVKPPIVPVPVVVPKQVKPATTAPAKTPAEPVKPPIVPVPVIAPRQIKPAMTEPAKTPVEPEKAKALPVQKLEAEPKAEPVPVAKAAPEPVVESKQSPPPVEPVKTPVEPVKAPVEPEKAMALPIQKPETKPEPDPKPEPKAETVPAAEPVIELALAAKAAPEPVVEPKQISPPVEPVMAPVEPEKATALPVQKPETETETETETEPKSETVPAAEPVEPALAAKAAPETVSAVEPVPEQAIDTYLSQNRMTTLLVDLQSPDHAHNWSTAQSTGLNGLDELLSGGLRPGLYMICSRPGEGKTSFALQIADTIAAQGKDVLWISLDMAREELLAKSLSRMTLLLDSAINKKNACTAQAVLEGLRDISTKAVLQTALQTYQETMSSFYCQEVMSEPSITDIEHVISQHMTMTGSKPVVIIDCLQYIRYSDGLTETAGIDRAVRTLMQFSRAHQLPILALSANIRDSYNSDVIISLQMEPAAGTLADPHVIELEILKNRSGAFNKKIPFNFFAAFNCLEEK